MTLDLKKLAESYTTPNGEATFWMLPYTTALASLNEQALERAKLRWVYVNDKTGERVTEQPAAHKRALDKAIAMKSVFKSDWHRETLWDAIDDMLAIAEPLTVAIDFADTLDDVWSAFKDYWSIHTEGTILERLEVFRAIVGIEPFNQWGEAYTKTRKNPAPAAPEMGEQEPTKDPLDLQNGEPSTEDTRISLPELPTEN